MNFKFLIKALAILATVISAFMSIPAAIALYSGETKPAFAFISVILTTVFISSIILLSGKNWQISRISTRESFMMVFLSWGLASFLGSLPFYISGEIPSFVDAFFETTSGFTTTGATILTSIENLPSSLLFWRSLTHWLGGMGIIVLTIAILPVLGIGGLQLLKAEAPGPTVDKITPRVAQTAKALWFIYMGMTAAQVILLRFAGMNYFDAFTHTFGTLATGGFSPKSASAGHYNSAQIDGIITFFMILAGINFTIHYRLLTGKTKSILKNTEIKVYLSILAVATLFLTANLYKGVYETIPEAFRYGSFQAASIMTTTGYGTADFAKWPVFSQAILFTLMFFGACSGSTGGGMKIIRLVTLFKIGINEMKYLLHPKAVFPLRIDGKIIKKDMGYSVAAFFFLYIFMLLLTALVCASSGVDILTSFATALATVGNIGPGFGRIGPSHDYAFYADHVKGFLSFAMIVGRLEVYTVLVIFTRSFWRK